MFSQKLINLGLDMFFQQQIAGADLANIIPVRVINVHRSGLHLVGDRFDQQIELRTSEIQLQATVGDWLLFDLERKRLVRRLERKSLFKRRAPGSDRREQLIGANVDTLFIVSSCNRDFNAARLERFLAIAREATVLAVVVLTKADLVSDPQEFVAAARRLAPGVFVEAVNALRLDSLCCLNPWLQSGQTIALLGTSGVGKTTLTNTLLGEPVLTTRAIREDDARGRHTTTSRSLYQLPGGAWLLDTPGMRELQLTDVRTGLDDVFTEISELARVCRFADCEHQNEPGCAVIRAIDTGEIDQARLTRWRKLVREEALNRATIAERRARDKATGRLYKSIIREKKTRKND